MHPEAIDDFLLDVFIHAQHEQLDLFADRTSTSEFRANQVRLYFSQR